MTLLPKGVAHQRRRWLPLSRPLCSLIFALLCVYVHPRIAGATGPVAPGAIAALGTFTDAFAHGRYDVMWMMLTPAARARWPNLATYAAFYRAKFAPVRLRGIERGAAIASPEGTGSTTTVTIPVSLDLAWRGSGPPGVLSLFQNVGARVVATPAGWRVGEAGPLDAAAAIIPPAHPPARMLRVPILMYHHVSSAPPAAPSQVGLTVSDREFAAQLAYLAGHGYQSITLPELFNALFYGCPLPRRPVVLTFDDGYLDNFSAVFPLLRRYGMVGEFDIITAYVGTTVGVNRYMAWPQIAALAAADMELESHTIDHQDLGVMSAAHAAYEMRFSRAILAAHIHHAVQFLVYPSGEPFRSGAAAAQQLILALLWANGYAGALLDQRQPSTLQNARAPYELPRVRVNPGESLTEFAAGLLS